MIINKPFIEERNSDTFLKAIIENENTNIKEEFYFSVENNYGKFLCNEISDPFVVAMLIPALMSGQDINVKGSISEMLQYHLENSLIFILSKVFNKKPIKIISESTITIEYDSKAVVTGFSGGVDSFATVLQHTSNNCPELLKLTHLALFNVGAYGNDELRTQKIFLEDAQRAKKFADEMDLPLVLLNSNISKAYEVNEITHGFSPRSSLCIMAGILSLQKLFNIYLIASGYTINKIKLDKWNQANYESLLASYLSTSSTKIIIANEDLTRAEKIKYIADNEIVQKFLHVCPADILNEKSKIKFIKDTYPNCSECFKCLRTLVIIDILGKLNDFTDSFNIKKYEDQKVSYIKYLLKNMNKDPFFKETYEFMTKYGYRFPKGVRIYARLKKYNISFKKVLRKTIRYGYYKLLYPIINFPFKLSNNFSSTRKNQEYKFKITGSKF